MVSSEMLFTLKKEIAEIKEDELEKLSSLDNWRSFVKSMMLIWSETERFLWNDGVGGGLRFLKSLHIKMEEFRLSKVD